AGGRLRLLDVGGQWLARDQARASAVGHEAPAPADQHDQAVVEACQVDDVDAQPDQPGEEPAGPPERPKPWDVRNPREPANDGHIAEVTEAEWLRGSAVEAVHDRLRDVAPGLDPALG